jgi:uncharacterized protein YbjQ (UPF0145 family)
MRVTTLETIAGRVVEETLGSARGVAMWSRRVTKKSTGGIRALEHMSMDDIANGLAEVREQAEAKMIISAQTMGADAVVGLRIELVELGNEMYQAIAFGTAVRTSALPASVPAYQAPVLSKVFGHIANDADSVILPFQQRRAAGGTAMH